MVISMRQQETFTRTPVSLDIWHFRSTGRAYILLGCWLLVNLIGYLVLRYTTAFSVMQIETVVWMGALATLLVSAPLSAFLTNGWFARYDEFQNSLKDEALCAYLRRFWSKSLKSAIADERIFAKRDGRDPVDELELSERLFSRIYHRQYGLTAFLPPFLILIVVAYALVAFLASNCMAVGPAGAKCNIGVTQQLVLSSVAGAFMFVVSDSVLSIRRKSLNTSDVYWYSLRLCLAIPIAIVLGNTVGTENEHTIIAFATGTLPVDVFIKWVRRFATVPRTTEEKSEDTPDNLLGLDGVTLPVVSVFASEGINSIEQLATADPVLLAIRTGTPFRFTLRLGSQAIVRRHFGPAASLLLPIGLADVVPIYLLVQGLNGNTGNTGNAGKTGGADRSVGNIPQIRDTQSVLDLVAVTLFPKIDPKLSGAVIDMKFRQIAAEEYTLMLARITPLDPSL